MKLPKKEIPVPTWYSDYFESLRQGKAYYILSQKTGNQIMHIRELQSLLVNFAAVLWQYQEKIVADNGVGV